MANHLRVSGSGSKVALLSDLCIEVKQRNGTAADIAALSMLGRGGVIWNTRFIQNQGATCCGGSDGPDGASFLLHPTAPAWRTASTMGSADDGTNNVYFEDSSCFNVGQWPDVDDHGRIVFRHSDIDGCSGTSHGPSSTWGGRQVEYYNNTFNAGDNRNMAGRYYWLRGGTGVWMDNIVNNGAGRWGGVILLEMGEEDETPSSQGCSSTYPCTTGGTPEQPAVGHNGTSFIIDPIYVWNQTGADAYAVSCCRGGWGSFHVRQNRDYFVNNGAKPGYTKYTYPHPLRGGGEDDPPASPTNLRIIAGLLFGSWMPLWFGIVAGIDLDGPFRTHR